MVTSWKVFAEFGLWSVAAFKCYKILKVDAVLYEHGMTTPAELQLIRSARRVSRNRLHKKDKFARRIKKILTGRLRNWWWFGTSKSSNVTSLREDTSDMYETYQLYTDKMRKCISDSERRSILKVQVIIQELGTFSMKLFKLISVTLMSLGRMFGLR